MSPVAAGFAELLAGAGPLALVYMKSIVAGALIILVYGLLRSARAPVRHGVLAAGMAALIALPPSQAMLPEVRVSLLPAAPAAASPAWAADATSSAVRTGAPVGPSGASATEPMASGGEGGAFWIALWGVGAALLLGRLLRDLHRLRTIAATADGVPGAWLPAIHRASRSVGLARPPRVGLSGRVPVAAVWGSVRPVVVLPSSAVDWTPARREVVLAHEFAHVARRDPLATLLAEVVAALHWPNPFAWAIRRLMRFEREAACDERVLEAGASRTGYADALLATARDLRGSLRPGIAMGAASGLGRRIDSVLEHSPPARRIPAPIRVAALAGLIVIAPALGACRLVPRATPPADSDADILAAVLRDAGEGDVESRIRAIWSLGDLEDPSAVPDLVGLLDEPDPRLRAMAAWSLGEIKDPRAADPLVDRLDDPDPLAREMFIRAIGELRHQDALEVLTERLDDEASSVRAAAVWALGELGGAGPLAAVEGAAADADAGVRRTVVQVLSEADRSAGRDWLRGALDDPAPGVRGFAARMLGASGGVGFVDDLMAALEDDAPEVRREAARALGMIGHRSALDGLIAHLGDDDLEVRSWVVWALDEIDPGIDAAHPKQGFDRERLVGVAN